MNHTKKTHSYYLMGYLDGKAGKDKQNINMSGMARRMYRDGYQDAQTGRVSH
jgi:hypothetical protein